MSALAHREGERERARDDKERKMNVTNVSCSLRLRFFFLCSFVLSSDATEVKGILQHPPLMLRLTKKKNHTEERERERKSDTPSSASLSSCRGLCSSQTHRFFSLPSPSPSFSSLAQQSAGTQALPEPVAHSLPSLHPLPPLCPVCSWPPPSQRHDQRIAPGSAAAAAAPPSPSESDMSQGWKSLTPPRSLESCLRLNARCSSTLSPLRHG